MPRCSHCPRSESSRCAAPTSDHEVMHARLAPFISRDSPKAGTLHLFMPSLRKGALLRHRAGSAAPLRIYCRNTIERPTVVLSPYFTCLFKLFTLLRCKIALQKEHPFGCCSFKMTCIHHSIAFRSNARSRLNDHISAATNLSLLFV